jgi:hypothetical protein
VLIKLCEYLRQKESAFVDCQLLALVGRDCGDLLSFERVSSSASAQG